MTRSRIWERIQYADENGILKAGINLPVQVRVPGTTTLISDTLYADPEGTTALNNPLYSDQHGVVEAFLDCAQSVDLYAPNLNLLMRRVGVYPDPIPSSMIRATDRGLAVGETNYDEPNQVPYFLVETQFPIDTDHNPKLRVNSLVTHEATDDPAEWVARRSAQNGPNAPFVATPAGVMVAQWLSQVWGINTPQWYHVARIGHWSSQLASLAGGSGGGITWETTPRGVTGGVPERWVVLNDRGQFWVDGDPPDGNSDLYVFGTSEDRFVVRDTSDFGVTLKHLAAQVGSKMRLRFMIGGRFDPWGDGRGVFEIVPQADQLTPSLKSSVRLRVNVGDQMVDALTLNSDGTVSFTGQGFTGTAAAFVTRSSDFQVPHGSAVPVGWTSALHNPSGFWSASQPTRFAAVQSGFYWVYGAVRWAVSSAGERCLAIRKNGTTIMNRDEVKQPSGSTYTHQSIGWPVMLAAGDYVEILADQTSGGQLWSYAMGNELPAGGMFRIA